MIFRRRHRCRCESGTAQKNIEFHFLVRGLCVCAHCSCAELPNTIIHRCRRRRRSLWSPCECTARCVRSSSVRTSSVDQGFFFRLLFPKCARERSRSRALKSSELKGSNSTIKHKNTISHIAFYVYTLCGECEFDSHIRFWLCAVALLFTLGQVIVL